MEQGFNVSVKLSYFDKMVLHFCSLSAYTYRSNLAPLWWGLCTKCGNVQVTFCCDECSDVSRHLLGGERFDQLNNYCY